MSDTFPIQRDLERILRASPAGPQQDALVTEMTERSRLVEGEAPVPTFLTPYFLPIEERKFFESAVSLLCSSLEKIGKAFLEDKKFSDQIQQDILDAPSAHGYSQNVRKRYRDLCEIDAGYSGFSVVARLDFFYERSTKNLRLLEYNCGEAAAVGFQHALQKTFLNTQAMERLSATYEISTDWSLPSVHELTLRKYREWCEKRGQTPDVKPFIAYEIMTDCSAARQWAAVGDRAVMAHYSQGQGISSEVVDPRSFDYDGKTLTTNGRPVSVIYRDTLWEILDESEQCEPLLSAIRDRNICVVPPLSEDIGNWKAILEILSDPQYEDFFTSEEREAHKRHIPWTRRLRDTETDFKGQTINTRAFVIKNKDLFALKPNQGYGGHGITLGPSVSQQEWEMVIQDVAQKGIEYVAQEHMATPSEPMAIVEDGELRIEDRNVVLGAWAHDGQFAGMMARLSSGRIINVTQGGGVLPTFFGAPK